MKHHLQKDEIRECMGKLAWYMQNQGVNVQPYPKVTLRHDPSQDGDYLGKTAYYEPVEKRIVVYTAGRHIKDILRSFCHEMVHHSQNLEGLLQSEGNAEDPQYAQNDPHMRKMEEDANLRGSMCMRDWTDGIKYNKK
jgi:hypothetical protein